MLPVEKAKEIWNIGGVEVPRGEIVEFYLGQRPQVRPGRVAVVYYYPKGPVWRRNFPGGDPIEILRDDDPDDPKSLLHHILHRGIEFHIVYGDKTDEIVLDIDPGEDVSREDVKRAVRLLVSIMRDQYRMPTETIYTGGRGYHIVGKLEKPVSIKRARKIALEIATMAVNVSDLPLRAGGSGPPRRDEIHIDLSPMKPLGSRRAPGSINVETGKLAVIVDPDHLDIFGEQTYPPPILRRKGLI